MRDEMRVRGLGGGTNTYMCVGHDELDESLHPLSADSSFDDVLDGHLRQFAEEKEVVEVLKRGR
jgi:hypothetical protein